MQTTKKFLKSAATFDGVVYIDNDNLFARNSKDKIICEFDGYGPEIVLHMVLRELGFKTEGV